MFRVTLVRFRVGFVFVDAGGLRFALVFVSVSRVCWAFGSVRGFDFGMLSQVSYPSSVSDDVVSEFWGESESCGGSGVVGLHGGDGGDFQLLLEVVVVWVVCVVVLSIWGVV